MQKIYASVVGFMRDRSRVLALATLGLLLACRPAMQEGVSSSKSADGLSPLAAAWQTYFVDDLKKRYPYELQESCKPVFAPAASDVPYVGTALFFHGYTSCPQQFFEMRDYLTQAGFNVLIPLLPGQGLGPAQVKGDTLEERQHYYQYLPKVDANGGQVYIDFVDAMNHIMSKAEGVRVVGGLSVGGGLAYGAIFQAPGLYDRALILAPFLTVPPDHYWRPIKAEGDGTKARWSAFYVTAKLQLENLMRKLLMVHKSDWVPKDKREVRWGEQCYYDNASGRAGICDSDIANIAATVQYGEHALALAERQATSPAFRKSPTKIQIASVEFDNGSDTRATKRTFRAVRGEIPFKMSLCFFRGIPHSFLSRYDHPELKMEWLTHFHERSRKFIVEGQFFDTSGPSHERVEDQGLAGDAVEAAFPASKQAGGPEEFYDLCLQ